MLKHIDGAHVCLTFDDGPDPRYTARILDILAEHECMASFFALGTAAERWPRLVRRIVDERHALGSHSFRHRRGWTMSGTTIRAEMKRSLQVLERITGYPPRWFRPPHGSLNPVMLGEAARLGMQTVLWSCSAIDWGFLGHEAGVLRRLQCMKAGDIVLLHDGKRRFNRPDVTVSVLPKILSLLEERKITPLSLDQAMVGNADPEIRRTKAG